MSRKAHILHVGLSDVLNKVLVYIFYENPAMLTQ